MNVNVRLHKEKSRVLRIFKGSAALEYCMLGYPRVTGQESERDSGPDARSVYEP